MKTNAKRIVALLVVLCMLMTFALTACQKECTTHVDLDGDGICDVCKKPMPEPQKPVTISVTAEKDVINYDETLPVTVTVENAEDKTYTWSYSVENVVKVENNVVSVVKTDMTVDIYVVITATSNADKNATASLPLTVKAPVVQGQVGELTSDMLVDLGNASITVTGTLTDYYVDHVQPFNSYETKYDMTVQMQDGLWKGSWNAQGSSEVITNTYKKGTDIVTNEYGEKGNGLEELYVNKDNQVSSTLVKNYSSIPATWQSQHLWNHLGQLNVTKFEYDAENMVYSYEYDRTSVDDLYLMTYLAYSLTPMLEETLDKLYLVVENGEITKLIAQTEAIIYPADVEDPDYTTYSVVELTFSEVGTTTVPQPQVYQAGENTSLLQAAFEKMSQATNYSFHAVDTQQSAPSTNPDDYKAEAVLSLSNPTVHNSALGNVTAASGTVGLQGWVTSDAILLCKTGKYDYAMDDKVYHLKYYGYKKTDEDYYDEFEYDSDTTSYVGVKRIKGNVMDQMPSFQLSANIFKFVSSTTANGVTNYTYELQETSISREVAMQLGLYNASNASATLQSKFTIVANENGIVSVTYPYSLISGTYVGYVTVTYSNVGTTQMPVEGVFDGYVARTVPTTWSETQTKHYSPDCSTLTSQTVASDVAFGDAFGTKYSNSQFPQYSAFFNVFGDNISGPFYDYTKNGTDPDGNTIFKKSVSITVTTDECDENSKISTETYFKIMDQLTTELAKYGFVYDAANSDTTGGATGYSDRKMAFINDELGIQVIVDNNRTNYFWIDFYNAGDYILNRD